MLKAVEPDVLVADQAALLLFLLFIHVADAEGGLTARDVQSLNQMLDHPDWTDSKFLRAAQLRLRARYFDLWQDYQKGSIGRDLASLSKQLNSVMTTPGAPSATDVKTVIDAFLERLARNASPVLLRLGLATAAPCRQTARAELDQLLKTACTAPLTLALAASPPLPRLAAPVASPARVPWPAATLALADENIWRRGRIEMRCAAVIPETADVRTFVLVPTKPTLLVYEPGQFVTLALPIAGKTVRRSYTISSSPSRPHAISITVKRVPGGVVSNWLHDNLLSDATLFLSGPHGAFSCFNAPAPKLLMMAAGSGITPIMSMLRWLADTASTADIVFINNIRSPSDVIFAQELGYLGTRMGKQLRLGIMPALDCPGLPWNGPIGHFSDQLIQLWAPDFAEREVFVCGPAGYMVLVRETLDRMGLPMAQYHEESFGTPNVAMMMPVASIPVARPASIFAPAELQSEVLAIVDIVFAKSGKTVAAKEGDFLLDLAEENDVAIDSGCRSGNCGTCKVIKTAGRVVMDEQTALSEADIADGYILTCVGRAFGDKVVLQA